MECAYMAGPRSSIAHHGADARAVAGINWASACASRPRSKGAQHLDAPCTQVWSLPTDSGVRLLFLVKLWHALHNGQARGHS